MYGRCFLPNCTQNAARYHSRYLPHHRGQSLNCFLPESKTMVTCKEWTKNPGAKRASGGGDLYHVVSLFEDTRSYILSRFVGKVTVKVLASGCLNHIPPSPLASRHSVLRVGHPVVLRSYGFQKPRSWSSLCRFVPATSWVTPSYQTMPCVDSWPWAVEYANP